MSDFEERFPDELISAYLDGELSPAEKTRVEEQLMDSAEHRRLFEELRALRDSVKGLPQVALDEGFAQRVLQRAEVEAAAQAGASSGKRTIAAETVAAETPAAPLSPAAPRGHFRGLLWAAATLAAAIALLVFNPLGDRAMRDSNLALHTAEEAAESSATKSSPGEELPSSRQAKKSQIGEAGAPSTNEAHDRMIFNSAGDANRKPTESPTNGVAAPQAEAPFPADKSANAGKRELLAPQSPAQGYTHSEQQGASPPKGNAFGQESDGAADRKQLLAKSREPGSGRSGLPHNAGLPNSDNKVASADALPQKPQAGPGVTASAAPFGAKLQHSAVEMLSQSHDGVVVVNLDVRPEALASHFIDRLLSRHEIDLQVAQVEKQLRDEVNSPSEKQSAQIAAAEVADDAVDEQALRREVAEAESYERANVAPASVDVVYVEATPEQVNALLAELRQSNEMVLAMGVNEPRENARALRDFATNDSDAAFGGQGGGGAAAQSEPLRTPSALLAENRLAAEQAKLKESDFASPKPESAAPSITKDDAANQASPPNVPQPASPVPPPITAQAELKLDAPADNALARSDAAAVESVDGVRQRGMAQRLPVPSVRRALGAPRSAARAFRPEREATADSAFGASSATDEIPPPAADEPIGPRRKQQLEASPPPQSYRGGAGGEGGEVFAPQAGDDLDEAGAAVNEERAPKDAFPAKPTVRVLLVLRAASPKLLGDLPSAAAEVAPAEAQPAEPLPAEPAPTAKPTP